MHPNTHANELTIQEQLRVWLGLPETVARYGASQKVDIAKVRFLLHSLVALPVAQRSATVGILLVSGDNVLLQLLQWFNWCCMHKAAPGQKTMNELVTNWLLAPYDASFCLAKL
ncbi:hypothetical protein [Rheinheimera maricola]|uniref:Uncharacterized protein n=1 Tax=Rheinheimera maricola TaxID=2793282 RepID=A0ABS7X7S7_9GAMM|nr:hypothetical protein [Rheinheimera maricola]MBZ9610783.1 hypothetical protein [Rheinheimera maricola]